MQKQGGGRDRSEAAAVMQAKDGRSLNLEQLGISPQPLTGWETLGE